MNDERDVGASAAQIGLLPSVEPAPVSPAVAAAIPSASGFYLTCRNCGVDRNSCARRAEIRSQVKGLGLTSIKFRCTERRPLYRPGQRVEVTWKYYPPDWVYEDGVSLETWPATIVQETKKGFLIVVDDVLSGNDLPAREYIKSDSLYCNVVAGKLAALDEPDRQTCEHCRSAENADGTVTGCSAVNGYDGMICITNCLAKAIEARQGGGADAVHESADPQGFAQGPSS